VERVAPRSVLEVVEVLRAAAGAGQVVLARGGGTKRDWVPPAAADLLVELGELDSIVEHAAGDMVVEVQAGVALRDLAPALAAAGQQLAVDIPSYDDGTVLDAGTVGGALAAAISGPRRLRYGRLRDLVLGVSMVRADGVVAASGGRVVKNVAGYDLGKLLTGSYGTLGLIVVAILRLHPLPAAVRYVTAEAPDAATAYAHVRAILGSQLAPTAVEVDRPAAPAEPLAVAAMLEGTAEGVPVRAEAAAGLVGGAVSEAAPWWFGRWPGGPSGTLVEAAFLPSRLPEVLDAVGRAGLPARGSAAVAQLHIGVPPDTAPAAVAELMAAVPGAVLRHAPPEVWAAVEPPPVDPGALALMRRVKDQFDPDHRLAPGRSPVRI
jgi:glycolate oxidase FAD binding subunit